MKTQKRIEEARVIVTNKLMLTGTTDVQKAVIGGMLNALMWVLDDPNGSTVERLLSGEALAAGQDHSDAMRRFRQATENIL